MRSQHHSEGKGDGRGAGSDAARDVALPEQTPMDKFKSLAKRLLGVSKEELHEQQQTSREQSSRK